jgi:hypothetical protein
LIEMPRLDRRALRTGDGFREPRPRRLGRDFGSTSVGGNFAWFKAGSCRESTAMAAHILIDMTEI